MKTSISFAAPSRSRRMVEAGRGVTLAPAGIKLLSNVSSSSPHAPFRHCEERSDEAIHSFARMMDCFATLAMTVQETEELANPQHSIAAAFARGGQRERRATRDNQPRPSQSR